MGFVLTGGVADMHKSPWGQPLQARASYACEAHVIGALLERTKRPEATADMLRFAI
jgi:hypothetical protein